MGRGGGWVTGPVFNLTTIIILLQIHGVKHGRLFPARVFQPQNYGHLHKLYHLNILLISKYFSVHQFNTALPDHEELVGVLEEGLVCAGGAQQGGLGAGGADDVSGGPHHLQQHNALSHQ